MENTELFSGDESTALLGRVVGGFQLERRLGAGASGEVWLGRHQVSGGLGAAKILRPEAGKNAHVRDYFSQEWNVIQRLDHPNVVRVFASGAGYLVTAFVEGTDLARRLRNPMQPHEALDLTLQVASALAHAHERGVIHRDVKPGNILVDREGNAFLADFGLARLDNQRSEGNIVVGTPAYMAPEQRHTSQVGPAADQYALARVLMEMLVGQTLPLDRDEALAEVCDSLTAALIQAVDRATRTNPDERFPSITDFAGTLHAIELDNVKVGSRLAKIRRDSAVFSWVADGVEVSAEQDQIWEATYSLNDLVQRDHIGQGSLRQFKDAYDLQDASWSIYGRRARLGDPLQPSSHARASDLVVLIHGGLSDREIWASAARALSQRNAQTLILVPDLPGHGRSPFVAEPQSELTRPRQIANYVLDLLLLLRYDGVPTVLVGHSMSALAMLTLRDDELGPLRSRVAISPVFPSYHPSLRRQLRAASLLVRSLRRFPWLLNAVTRLFLRYGEQTRDLSKAARSWLYQKHLQTDPRAVASYFQGTIKAQCAPGEQLKRILLLYGQDDPLLPQDVRERAADELDIPEIRIQKLATGGHQPQLEIDQAPGFTAQNHEEIVHAIESMMVEAEGDSGASRRSPAARNTPMAHEETLLPDAPELAHTAVTDRVEGS